MNDLFEACLQAARDARDVTGGGPEYETRVRDAILKLEDEYHSLLSDEDINLVLAAPFGGMPVDAGLRDPDYEAALEAQRLKDAA